MMAIPRLFEQLHIKPHKRGLKGEGVSEESAFKASVDAAMSVVHYLNGVRKKKSNLNRCQWFYLALAKKTLEFAQAGVDPEEMIFDPSDVMEWLHQNAEIKITTGSRSDSDYISDRFRDLEKYLEDNVRVKNVAIEFGLSCYGMPGKKIGGGSRNRNEYFIQTVKVADAEVKSHKEHLEEYPVRNCSKSVGKTFVHVPIDSLFNELA